MWSWFLISHIRTVRGRIGMWVDHIRTVQGRIGMWDPINGWFFRDHSRLLWEHIASANQNTSETLSSSQAKDFAASTKLRNEAKELTSAAESRKRELTEERHASEQHVADKGLWAGLAHLLFYSGRGYTSVRAELEAMSAMSTAGGSTRSEDIDDPIIETVDLDDIDDGTAELLAKEQEARRELEERQKNQEQRVEKAKRQTEKIETVFAQLVCALINKPHDGLSSGAPATTQDFSSNQDSSTSTPSIPPPLRQSFLNNVLPTLHVLNLTDCNLHKTSLEGLLEVISERDLPLIALCVDSNPALGDPGAMVLSQFLARRITEGKKRRITRAFWHARGREYVDDAREECEWAKFEAKKLEDPESVGGSGPQFWEVVGDWVEEDESAMLNH